MNRNGRGAFYVPRAPCDPVPTGSNFTLETLSFNFKNVALVDFLSLTIIGSRYREVTKTTWLASTKQ